LPLLSERIAIVAPPAPAARYATESECTRAEYEEIYLLQRAGPQKRAKSTGWVSTEPQHRRVIITRNALPRIARPSSSKEAQMGSWRSYLLVLVALVLSGCGSVKIRQIVQDPVRYHNKNVRVDGLVTRSTGIIVAGAYTVDDGTGRITVLSNRPVPPRGAKVSVNGTVQSGVSLMGRTFGTTLRERDVRVR
jgi:hypothetical protein